MFWLAIALAIIALFWETGRAHSRHLDRMQHAQRIAFGRVNEPTARDRNRDFNPLLTALWIASIAFALHSGWPTA
jgi:hypothetical protein